MTYFQLDQRLANDCIQLGELKSGILLLLNNAHYPWFVLVPKVDKTELYQLEKDLQLQIMDDIQQLSEFIKIVYNPDKLNVASIGNVVKQMHIHILGRFESDPCWPGVVWGQPDCMPYRDDQLDEIKTKVKDSLRGFQG
jgi:diadenosine tetraphosphate (Ap4A) HIT family hydrolase